MLTVEASNQKRRQARENGSRRCQKQPCTKTTALCLGRTTAGPLNRAGFAMSLQIGAGRTAHPLRPKGTKAGGRRDVSHLHLVRVVFLLFAGPCPCTSRLPL